MKMSIEIRNRGNRAGRAEAGFSLVEIMVGLVIGMLGILVIFQVFAVSEGQKRTTTSGSDAQQNGSYAMYSLGSQVRAAGSGFVYHTTPSLLGCTIAGLPAAPAYMAPAPPAARMIPVLITDGGGGASDSITVIYGTAAGIGDSVGFSGAAGTHTTTIPVSSTFGFNLNDYVLAVDQAGVPCAIEQISAAPAAIPGPITVTALDAAYSANAFLLNLGPGPTGAADPNTNGPVMTEFAVLNSPAGSTSFSLAALDLLGRPPGAGAPTVLVDNVVNIQAQYGVDTTNDGVIDAWMEPTGLWAATALTSVQIEQIKAIRVGMVVRSGLMEKSTGGACTTTLAAPVPLPAVAAAIPAEPAAPEMDTSGIPNFGCYRYKVFETVIPLRNIIW